MDADDFYVVLGVVGSIASVIGLLIAAPGIKSKIIHLAYAIFITILTAGVFAYRHKMTDAKLEIENLNRIEREATVLLTTADRSTAGSMGGFMLASLSFMEKHKNRLPETYGRAVRLCESSGLLENARDRPNSLSRFYTLQEASGAMEYLVKGIAASEGSLRK